MKKIKLLGLYFKNFKGIKELDIDFEDITNIYGENATGKTSVVDGFDWLLFDKDSQDRVVGDKEANFQIKTLDANNEVIHGLEHQVTGALEVDDKKITLSKIYKEKWTKKRGEANKQLTGHETLYYIDDVPVKKSEYQQKINDIIDENLFKLITNSLYFSTKIKWQDRRNTIIDIAGDITIENVINYKPELKALAPALQDKDIDTLKKSIAARKKKLNDDIKSIPYRIDECNNSIKEDIDFEVLDFKKRDIIAGIKSIEDQLLDSSKLNDGIANQQKELYSLKSKLQKMEFEAQSNKDKPLRDLKYKLREKEYTINSAENKLSSLQEKKGLYTNKVLEVTENNETLKNNWYQVRDEVLEFDESKFVCPTCNRPFETSNVESMKVTMTENFNQNKAKHLSIISEKGKQGKEIIGKINSDIKEIETQISVIEADIKTMIEEKESIENQINNFVPEDILNTNTEYQQLTEQVKELETKLLQPSIVDSQLKDLKEKKEQLNSELEEVNSKLTYKSQNETLKTRIKELMDQERQLSQQIAQLEKQEYLTEEFIKTKVELMESNINNRFKFVRFKLFNTQVNGGVEECCEALVDGVPFSNANTASQINAGLDIINALSNYYKVSAPIFIDNRESINKIIECDSQIINLIVSKDKTLRIESEVK